MKRAPILTLALVLAWGGVSAADQPFEFTNEPWTGSAVYSQTDGSFSHCLMAAQFDRQMSLVVALDRAGGVSLGVRNPRWALTLLETQPMAFSLGGSQPHEAMATAVDSTLLLVRFEDGESILAELALAPTVSVAQETQGFQFVMVNFAAALEALKDCNAAARIDVDVAADPLAAADPAAASVEDRDRTILVDPVTLDQTVARNFLQAAGLTEFTLMTPNELSDFLGDARAAWTDGAIYGALYTIAPRQNRLQTAADQVIRVLTNGCSGVFTSAPIVGPDDDGAIVRRSAVCDENPLGMLFRTSVINGQSGTLIILHAALREDAERLAIADDLLIGAIRDGSVAVE
ncbi:MAG: hypothetical protein ACFCVH_11335 [Alphaproteobacteria bacterium]